MIWHDCPGNPIKTKVWSKILSEKHLKQMFKAKFEQIRQKKGENHPSLMEKDSLQVLSLSEICTKYEIRPMPMQSGFKNWLSSWLWVNRQKVDLLNDLCKKLKGKY